MLLGLLSLVISLRVALSPVVDGVLDLQHRSHGSWQTYNNVSVLARVNGEWNSSELNGGAIEVLGDGWFRLPVFDNGAAIDLHVSYTVWRELQFNVYTRPESAPIEAISLSNDYGLASTIRFVSIAGQVFDALSMPEPTGGHYQAGDFYPLPLSRVVVLDGQHQRVSEMPGEAFLEVRRVPWLPEHPDPGHNWFERVHLTIVREIGPGQYVGWWAFGLN